jgi:hypothetical protein
MCKHMQAMVKGWRTRKGFPIAEKNTFVNEKNSQLQKTGNLRMKRIHNYRKEEICKQKQELEKMFERKKQENCQWKRFTIIEKRKFTDEL